MAMMTATKMLTYNNRRLVPGEDFEAKSHRDMKVLLATRKAKVKREEAEVPVPPAAIAAKIADATDPGRPVPSHGSGPGDPAPELRPADLPPVVVEGELAIVRAEYEAKIGKRPYWNWSVAELREKMDQAGS
jgi:hypothetical protein